MTDVKTGGQPTPRTMAGSGQDTERSKSSYKDRPKVAARSYRQNSQRGDDNASSVQPDRLKVRIVKSSNLNLNKDGKAELNEDGESLYHAYDMNETCACRITGCGIFEETSSSQDSSSADSQSVHADNRVDFERISIGDSNSSLSSSSEEDFVDIDGLHDGSFIIDDSDWDDYELRSDNDDEWSVAMSVVGHLPDFELVRAWRRRGEAEEAPPVYPHRALMYHECQICLSRILMRRRICCDFHICADCMTTYVSMKVNEAKVQIECPNDCCTVLIHRDEVNERLPKDMKDKFAKFLVNANADPLKKTCPACSEVYCIEPKMLSVKKKKLKDGLKVQCPQCSLFWCFQCQAPFHAEMTCKQYQKGDRMVKKWAKELSAGQSNAQKCPKCKIFIQKVNGCDHMKCSKCNTDFCYRCGDRYISIKLLGNHWSKFSLFGCKYRLMPKRPALRRLIRGANFAARLVAGVVLAGLGLAAGAIIVGASVVIVPGYGIFRLGRHLQLKEKCKRDKSKQTIGRFTDRDIPRVFMLPTQGLTRSTTETEVENLDTQQVQVMIHRSVSFSHEDEESLHAPQDEGYEFYFNKYTSEGTDMVVSGMGNSDSDQVVVLTEVTEVQNFGGYPTVVAHIVSKIAADKEATAKSKASGKNQKEGIFNQNNAPQIESSLGKGGLQANDGDDAAHKEASLTEGSFKKTLASTAEIPSCSWENLSGSVGVDSGYGENESDQHVHTSEPKYGNLICGTGDDDSTKRGNNGCFGNIFSRRALVPMANLESPVVFKSPTSHSQKKSLNNKAGTWEKCHRDHVKSLLKSSPLDPVNDFNNLSYIMQRSPVSSVDITDVLNCSVKNVKTDFSDKKQGDNLSESFNVEKDNMFGNVPLFTSSDDFEKAQGSSSESLGNRHSCVDGVLKNPNNPASNSYFPFDGSHISLSSEVTHL